jgi:hypothetical protein
MDGFASVPTSPVTSLRRQLWRNGYEPIPVVAHDAPGKSPGKRPGISGWQSATINGATILQWGQGDLLSCSNTGIRCGLVRAVDIDVLEPTLAKAITELAFSLLGETSLLRIGRAPKLLLCYRVVEPGPKAKTLEFCLPDGTKAQVEMLGRGQQFVAYGVHPDTGAEYEWPQSGPDIVPLEDLPLLDPAAEEAFLAAAEGLIRDAGGRPIRDVGNRESAAASTSPSDAPPLTSRGNERGVGSGGDFFRNVNSLAVRECGAWFQRLFPRGKWQQNGSTAPGAWRVSSADLGRPLEEDISVHPITGGFDFGTDQPVTPIDLVMSYGGAKSASEAAFTLCEWMQVSPESLGWHKPTSGPNASSSSSPSSPSSQSPPPARPALIDPRNWTDLPPARTWIVPDWVPRGVVTGLYGDGAVGKSLVAMQLLSATALGQPWLGLDVTPGRALGVFCEDDETELQRRQWAINRSLGVGASQLENLRYLARLGHDNAMITFDSGDVGAPTHFTAELHEICREFRPDLLVLDTIADLFPANENDRAKVRQFIQTVLGGFARRHNCAVLALGHPSVAGINSGTGQSGSTAWNNTFRSRFYLTRESGDDADPNARLLSRKKANYAPRDAEVRLLWQEGVFRAPGAVETRSRGLTSDKINKIFDEIERAWRAGNPWSHRPETRTNGRMLQAWAKQELGVPIKQLTTLLGEWLMNGFLAFEEADKHKKTRGLRVLKRLQP